MAKTRDLLLAASILTLATGQAAPLGAAPDESFRVA